MSAFFVCKVLVLQACSSPPHPLAYPADVWGRGMHSVPLHGHDIESGGETGIGLNP